VLQVTKWKQTSQSLGYMTDSSDGGQAGKGTLQLATQDTSAVSETNHRTVL